MSFLNSVKWLSVNKYSRTLLAKMETNSQGYTFLVGSFGGDGICPCANYSVNYWQLQHYLPIYMWSGKKIFLFFLWLWGEIMHAGGKHRTFTGTFTRCFTCRVFVCLHAERAISQRTERELGSSLQLFSARGINKSARFCSLGSGYWFLHKVMLVLSVESKVASKLWKYCTCIHFI